MNLGISSKVMTERAKGRSNIHDRLNNPELRCKTGCGFYGNQAWQGYCSVCYREVNLKQQKARAAAQNRSGAEAFSSEVAGQFEQAENSKLKFNKFEEKKKFQSESKKQSVRKLFKKSPGRLPTDGSLSSSGSGPSGEATRSSDFREFLKTLKKPAAQDVNEKCKSFVQKIANNTSLTVEKQRELVHDFYAAMAERLQNHVLFRGQPQEVLDRTLDGVEKYVLTRLYTVLFCPPSTDDETKDLELQRKIRTFQWITPQHLDANIVEENEQVQKLIQDAQKDLSEINTRRAPQDKLACVVRCCKTVFKIIHFSTPSGGAVSADDFLPCLIFIVLNANPTMLHSNIQYISRFCNPDKIVTGEAGYYFTNLCCVVTFIENLDAQALSITQEEFDRNMYVDGQGAATEDSRQQAEPPVTCPGLELMTENMETLSNLRERQQSLKQEALQLQEQMTNFRLNIVKEIDAILGGTSKGNTYLKLDSKSSAINNVETVEAHMVQNTQDSLETSDETVYRI